MSVKVLNFRARAPEAGPVINVTSKAAEAWQRELSPFNLGPVEMTLHLVYLLPRYSQNMENAWQFSKVYACHVGPDGAPTPDYFKWAAAGFNDPEARRFPMGRGAKPQYSLYVDPTSLKVEYLDYIEARKKIYIPLYARNVVKTAGYATLKYQVKSSLTTVFLRDFDGYNAGSKSFAEIVEDPKKKMGHAFILAYLIESDV